MKFQVALMSALVTALLVSASLKAQPLTPLPAAWSAPVAKLDAAAMKAPYALAPRPMYGEDFNRVDFVALDPRTLQPVSRSPTTLRCDRVHASLQGEVLCYTNIVPGKGVKLSNPASYFYAHDLSPLRQYTSDTQGRPNRARISADGRFSATTAFVKGHSYIVSGGETFSTSTVVVREGSIGEDIEAWPVEFNGKKVTASDLNLWGVTFHPKDTNRFLVTVYFDQKPYLAEGSVSGKRITVLKPNVECPSYSPSGDRIAFKKRTSALGWSPAVMALATLKENVIAMDSSVDDQIEWLDENHLLFEVADRPLVGQPTTHLFSIDLRQAIAVPRLWLQNARAAAIVRN